jgi:hypothetical protein
MAAVAARSPAPHDTGERSDGVDSRRLAAASAGAALRLWHLAFAVPGKSHGPQPMDDLVKHNVAALLQVDTLDRKLFPRRPALLPQLLQAVNEPDAAAEKLSRIVAHDPVLVADVLRLANSGLYRLSVTPIETIQRAIVVCGVDGLRGLLAAAVLQPAFRASAKNFPRLPRILWDRTERAARAAELFALQLSPADRFEAQLVVLLSALGPLVVYSALVDVYARNSKFPPNGSLGIELIGELATGLSLHIAGDWQSSTRLVAALDDAPGEFLTAARHVGELFGTLSFLESQTVITREARLETLSESGLPVELTRYLWEGLHGSPA